MDVSPERLVEQARERFELQDYYGAIHLLEEVITSGRAFADAHHLLGLSYSLAGQPEKALEQLDRALALNPHYVEALIHRALVLNELGREEEASALLRRAPAGGPRGGGLPGDVATQRRAPAPPAPAGEDPAPGRKEKESVRRWSVALLALTCACTRSAADHEELGDRAYTAADYRSALAEYQLGVKAHPGSASLDAKLGAAALHTEEYAAAAEAYRALARDDGSRVDEAADALERVVRAALGPNDRGALASALTGLREIAPARPLGRYATLSALDAVDRGDTATALALLPVATAASGDPARADSLLYVYAMTLVRVRACSTAVRVV